MFKDKVVVITGASSGIGAEMAVQLSRLGSVPVLMARSHEKLEAVGRRITGKHKLIVLDVTSSEQVHQAMEEVCSSFGSVDVLINNAGFGLFDTFLNIPLEQFAEIMDVNFMGAVRCTKAVLPGMLLGGKGHIINIASVAGKLGTAKSTAYTASKHALVGFTNSLRQELVGTGVLISAINPGPIETAFFDKADPSGDYLRKIGRFALKPEKVAEAVMDMIAHGRVEITLPFAAGVGVKLFHMFPRLFEKLSYQLLNKK